MKASSVIDILTSAVPREMEWSKGEPYGAYNVKSTDGVKSVLYCVTPTPDVIKYFNESRYSYDLLISHHPYIRPVPEVILHTALDCCEGGLNWQWMKALGVKNPQHFDRTLGWYGKIDPISYEDLCKKCECFMRYKIIGQKYNTLDKIESVVICTGLGGAVNDIALKTDADCYILGESWIDAKRSGFRAMIECGHTNTEWMGVLFMKKLLSPHGIRVDLVPHHLDHFAKEVYQPFKFESEYDTSVE